MGIFIDSQSQHFCGLDFGTTNSAIGVWMPQKGLELVQLEEDFDIIPSALFYDYDKARFFYGNRAMDRFIQGEEGRLMMSLKSILGTDTIETSTFIQGLEFSFERIIGFILGNIKKKAEE